MESEDTPAIFERWLADLEARHLANLRVQEVTRALRALSSSYVERRHTVAGGGPLASAGKRAAFALFYAPLHFLTVHHVLHQLGARSRRAPSAILDIGCGTGAAGAAWALLSGGAARVTGIDRHPWALEEARRTFRALGVHGIARRGDADRLPAMPHGSAAIAAYVLNELPDEARARAEAQLFASARQGVAVLILEPIARAMTPWWNDAAARAVAEGGQADEWRFAVTLPELLRTFDKAAGLNHRELTARSIWLPGAR